jgi:hypothetical protein
MLVQTSDLRKSSNPESTTHGLCKSVTESPNVGKGHVELDNLQGSLGWGRKEMGDSWFVFGVGFGPFCSIFEKVSSLPGTELRIKKRRPRLQRDSDLGYIGYRGGEISKQGGSLEVKRAFDKYQENF